MPPAFSARNRLSLVMIVRNEEKILARCLESAARWVSEMVIVDTGSTDRTVAIAESLGARVLHQAWADDFSPPRNLAIDSATHEWVLAMDADDVLVVEDEVEFARAIGRDQPAAYTLDYRSRLDDGSISVAPYPRLFRRTVPTLRYRGQVHEQLIAIAERAIIPATARFLHLVHDGYQQERMVDGRKVERNRRLARALVDSRPDDPYSWFVLGISTEGAESLQAFERAIDFVGRKTDDPEIWRESYVLYLEIQLATDHLSKGQRDEAQRVIDFALRWFPDSPDLRFLAGQLALQAHQPSQAEAHFRACLTPQAQHYFLRRNPAATGQGAQRCLGALLFERGQWHEAEPLLRGAAPADPATELRWAHCLMLLQRFPEAENVLRKSDDRAAARPLLAELLLDTARPEEALTLLDPAGDSALLTGWVYLLLGRANDAAAAWSQSGHATLATFRFLRGEAIPVPLDASPMLLDRWLRRLLVNRRFDEVDRIIERAPQLGAGWPPLRRQWAATLALHEQLPAALELLGAAVEAAPEDPDVIYWLGYCALHLGKLDEARQLWTTCLTLQANHPLASEGIRLLSSSGR